MVGPGSTGVDEHMIPGFVSSISGIEISELDRLPSEGFGLDGLEGNFARS